MKTILKVYIAEKYTLISSGTNTLAYLIELHLHTQRAGHPNKCNQPYISFFHMSWYRESKSMSSPLIVTAVEGLV